jgi:hypothetical protein
MSNEKLTQDLSKLVEPAPPGFDWGSGALSKSLAEIFPDRNKGYAIVDILDWNREGAVLGKMLSQFTRPLPDILDEQVRPHLQENVSRITSHFPGKTLSSHTAQTYVQPDGGSKFEKIGGLNVRKMIIYRPPDPVMLNPENSPLYKKVGEDESVVMLTPALEYTIPVAIAKLGNKSLENDPLRAAIVYTRQYVIKHTKQDRLEPQLRGTTTIVFENRSAIEALNKDQEWHTLQAHLREAWNYINPISGGRADSN